MQLNVSAVKTYLRSPLEWYYAHHLRRVPRTLTVPLEVGLVWHALMESFYSNGRFKDVALASGQDFYKSRRDAAVEAGFDQTSPDKFEKFIHDSDLIFRLFDIWTDPIPDAEIIAVETPIELPLPGMSHTLIGKPDVLIRWQRKLWHHQHRTLSDRTSMATYLDAAPRDLHELAYAWLIVHGHGSGYAPSDYGGTYFNIARKLSNRRLTAEPEAAFIRQPVPLSWSQVLSAIDDLCQIADDMQAIVAGHRRPVSNREADRDRFGHYLTPYFRVYTGAQDIYDEKLFMTAPDRYAPEAPVGVTDD